MDWGAIAGGMLLGAGALLLVVGGIGINRFPHFYSRLHAAGVIDTLAAGLVLAGLAPAFGVTLGTLSWRWSSYSCSSRAPRPATPSRVRPSERCPGTPVGAGAAVIAELIDILLLAFLVLTALYVALSRDLLAVIMVFSANSLLRGRHVHGDGRAGTWASRRRRSARACRPS